MNSLTVPRHTRKYLKYRANELVRRNFIFYGTLKFSSYSCRCAGWSSKISNTTQDVWSTRDFLARPHHQVIWYFLYTRYDARFEWFLVRSERRRGRLCHRKNFIFRYFPHVDDIFIISRAARPIKLHDFLTIQRMYENSRRRWANKRAQTSKVRLVSFVECVCVHLGMSKCWHKNIFSNEGKQNETKKIFFYIFLPSNVYGISALYARITCVFVYFLVDILKF